MFIRSKKWEDCERTVFLLKGNWPGRTSAQKADVFIITDFEIWLLIHNDSGRQFDKTNMRLIDEGTAA